MDDSTNRNDANVTPSPKKAWILAAMGIVVAAGFFVAGIGFFSDAAALAVAEGQAAAFAVEMTGEHSPATPQAGELALGEKQSLVRTGQALWGAGLLAAVVGLLAAAVAARRTSRRRQELAAGGA